MTSVRYTFVPSSLEIHTFYNLNKVPGNCHHYVELRGCPGLVIRVKVTKDDVELPLKSWKAGVIIVMEGNVFAHFILHV